MPRSISRRKKSGRAGRSYRLHLSADDRTDLALILGSARNLVAENTSLRAAMAAVVGDDMAGGRSVSWVSATSAVPVATDRQRLRHEGDRLEARISRPSARLKSAPHSISRTSCSERRMSSPSIWCSVEGRAALSCGGASTHEADGRACKHVPRDRSWVEAEYNCRA